MAAFRRISLHGTEPGALFVHYVEECLKGGHFLENPPFPTTGGIILCLSTSSVPLFRFHFAPSLKRHEMAISGRVGN